MIDATHHLIETTHHLIETFAKHQLRYLYHSSEDTDLNRHVHPGRPKDPYMTLTVCVADQTVPPGHPESTISNHYVMPQSDFLKGPEAPGWKFVIEGIITRAECFRMRRTLPRWATPSCGRDVGVPVWCQKIVPSFSNNLDSE